MAGVLFDGNPAKHKPTSLKYEVKTSEFPLRNIL